MVAGSASASGTTTLPGSDVGKGGRGFRVHSVSHVGPSEDMRSGRGGGKGGWELFFFFFGVI